ncbi:MAG: glycosyltransferase family 4 protein [Candidatus Kapaibacterium sp.]
MNILFIGPLKSSFVKNDIEILSEKHNLRKYDTSIGRGLKGMINLIKITLQTFFEVFRNDAVFCWFADYTTLVPVITAKLLGKKSYVIAGGFDILNVPEIDSGAITRRGRWFCVRKTFKYTDLIFPVSQFAGNSLHELTNGDHANYTVIYNGVKTDKFINYNSKCIKRKYITTVSQADTYVDYHMKGSDRFIRIASKMPHLDFLLLGLRGSAYDLAIEAAKGINNIEIIKGPLDLYSEIIPYYYRSYSYAQLSIAESFCMAVVESMACGCIPVVNNGGALPEVAGDAGYVTNNDDEIIIAINKSIHATNGQREKAISQSKKFDISIKRKILLEKVI